MPSEVDEHEEVFGIAHKDGQFHLHLSYEGPALTKAKTKEDMWRQGACILADVNADLNMELNELREVLRPAIEAARERRVIVMNYAIIPESIKQFLKDDESLLRAGEILGVSEDEN